MSVLWPTSTPRQPWRWIGLGLALLVLSMIVGLPWLGGLSGLDPTAAIAVHVVAYLPLLVGVFQLTEHAPRRWDRRAVLDALVIVLAAVAVAALVTADGRVDGAELVVLLLLDVAVLVAASPLLGPNGRGRAQYLLAAGLNALLVADALLVLGAVIGWDSEVAASVTLLLAVLLLGAAGLQPSARRLVGTVATPGTSRHAVPTQPRLTARRVLLVGPGLAFAPVLLLLTLLGVLPESADLAALAAFAVFVLAAARLADLVGELARQDTERSAQQRFTAAFDRSPGGLGVMVLTGADAGRLVEVNASLSHLIARPVRELMGASVADLVHPSDATGALRLQLSLAAAAGGAPVGESVITRLATTGRPRWGVIDIAPFEAEAGGSRHGWAVLQVEDVTERVDTEAELARQARRDPLTGLANRIELLEDLRECLQDHARGGRAVAVLLLDLDRFKLVNDAHGHAVGDELLIEVAARLRRLRVDTVCRLGGDEFAVVVRLPTGRSLEQLLRRLHGVLEPVVALSRGDVVVSASVGVVVHDRAQGDSAADAEGLLRQADIAMYRAKSEGGSRHEHFGPRLQAEVDTRHAIENELRAALSGGGLSVVYQPIIDLNSGEVAGHEALVRMVRRVQGLTLGPADFLEVAEESGLVKGMGGFVMSTALGQALRDPAGRRMAVNVSGRELAEPDFAGRVLRRLNAVGLAPDRLTIEVTENAVVPYLDGVVPQLSRLRAEGVTVALDDFGTGYSSLTHLRVLPVDIVKIDRSFVERVVLDGPDRQIVAAVTDLVNGLGLATVAEGIETQEQHDAVVALGCRFGQGYLYGRPAESLVPVAPVAQPAEAGALKVQKYGFESRRGHTSVAASDSAVR